jgi:hypothetical protein
MDFMGLQCDKQPASLGRNGSSGVDWCPIERHSPLNRLIGFLRWFFRRLFHKIATTTNSHVGHGSADKCSDIFCHRPQPTAKILSSEKSNKMRR